jgi:high-affinity K+ transport system ATPase subunit B
MGLYSDQNKNNRATVELPLAFAVRLGILTFALHFLLLSKNYYFCLRILTFVVIIITFVVIILTFFVRTKAKAKAKAKANAIVQIRTTGVGILIKIRTRGNPKMN